MASSNDRVESIGYFMTVECGAAPHEKHRDGPAQDEPVAGRQLFSEKDDRQLS